MTSKGFLLLLGGAHKQFGPPCLRQAKNRGLQVWLTDTKENLEKAPEMVALADKVTPLSYIDQAACVDWAVEQARSTPIIGVFGFREFAMETIAAVAQALGLIGNSPEAVATIRNKFACRQMLRKHGFRQPAALLCSHPEDARAFVAANPPGPWILKPPAAMGSLGISLIKDANDWEHAFVHLAEASEKIASSFEHQGIAYGESEAFLIECFQPGDEFSAEGLFIDGHPHVLVLTAKMTTQNFVEMGHTMPAELGSETTQNIISTVRNALNVLDLRWGHFHVEFWLDEGEPVLGEIHGRPGGDYINRMIEITTGIDLYGTIFDQLLGRPLNPDAWKPYRGAAIRYLLPQPGRIAAIKGWDEAIADPHVLIAESNLQPGNRILPIHSSRDRLAFILTIGETAKEAALVAENLCAAVEVSVVY